MHLYFNLKPTIQKFAKFWRRLITFSEYRILESNQRTILFNIFKPSHFTKRFMKLMEMIDASKHLCVLTKEYRACLSQNLTPFQNFSRFHSIFREGVEKSTIERHFWNLELMVLPFEKRLVISLRICEHRVHVNKWCNALHVKCFLTFMRGVLVSHLHQLADKAENEHIINYESPTMADGNDLYRPDRCAHIATL